jgi:plasmid replication initiation protein
MRLGKIVKQHNDFVRDRLIINNLISSRVLVAFISLIKIEDEDFHEYSIRAVDIINNYDGGKSYKELERACDILASAVYRESNKNNSFIKMPLFQRISFQNGDILARFNPDLKSFLLNLKANFTQYKIDEFLILPSIYSQRIFEYLMSWHSCSETIISIEALHNMLNTPLTFQKDFTHMRLRVLDKAYKDINERTSLKYEWEALKTKNKVTAIRFIFSQENRMVIQKETIKKLTDKFISEQARPGETWEEARERLSNR